jgi:hypothetical protein
MDLLIPAAGLATRMRGLPKFLLPIDKKYTTLLENHLLASTQDIDNLDNILIATRPDLVKIIKSLNLDFPKLSIIEMETSTMNETILNLLQHTDSEYFQLVMPDTYFSGEQSYGKLSNSPDFCDLALWEIRPEQRGKLGEVDIDLEGIVNVIVDKNPDSLLKYSWGSLTFNLQLKKYIDVKEPHIGYAIFNALKNDEIITTKIIEGKYYDCGTPEEYLALLKEELL